MNEKIKKQKIEMNKEIELIKNDIDWQKILELAFKRVDWGKTFTLYNLGNVKVTCIMQEFNFIKQRATFLLNTEYIYKDQIKNDENTVNYFLENFTIENLKSLVLRKVRSSLRYILAHENSIEAKAKYINLYICAYEMINKDIIKAGFQKELNEIANLSNNKIKRHSRLCLRDEAGKILNANYYKAVETYEENNFVDLPYVRALLLDLNKEVSKNEIKM